MAINKVKTGYQVDFWFRGKRHRETYPNKQLALMADRERKLQIARGTLNIAKPERITLKEFAKGNYSEYASTHKRSFDRSDKTFINRFIEYFEDRLLSQISKRDIEEYVMHRLKDISISSVKRELVVLRNIFTKAIDWRIIKDNPVTKIRLPKYNDARIRFLTLEEKDKLLANCTDHLRPIVEVALHTGMRRGEILNLQWKDVDIENRIIHLMLTKNNERRDIPFNNRVTEILIGLKEQNQGEYVFQYKGQQCKDVKGSFGTALDKAGIKDFRFHDLRHTFASHLVMAGVDIVTVKELLGHKKLEMTMRYISLSPNVKKQAVGLLCDRFTANSDRRFLDTLGVGADSPKSVIDEKHDSSGIN